MPCYNLYDKDHKRIGTVCGKLGPHCADCGTFGVNLCDFPVGNGKTCDRKICDHCANLIGPDIHYCEYHFLMWSEFRAAGGVQRELTNVVPFQEPLF